MKVDLPESVSIDSEEEFLRNIIVLTPLVFDGDGDHLVPAESLNFIQRAAAIYLLLDGEVRHYGQGQSVAPPTH